ncbi:magnesium transporter [Maridesulfovibrio ferrireducens]|uniref:magnesium transporter n=1 Tax=Maridesulfovibrio ferrireducens TaxID=246191 RepID=UPI001A22577E|nr:magnesium transporter [Maridesulfovibrio ferrireducens]MBI9111382.1 magnesium transporter [Maridesulfovibrio ferrireducens]
MKRAKGIPEPLRQWQESGKGLVGEVDQRVIDAMHPADAADHIEELGLDEQVKFIKQLPIRDAADSIAEMEKYDQRELIEKLNLGMAARILEFMSPDDATDILEGLDDDLRESLLRQIKAEDREEISTLLTFDPETAGGVMNTEVAILLEDLTVDQAIASIRAEVEDKSIPYYAYLVDRRNHLTGAVSLRDLLISRPGKKLKELIHNQHLISVTYEVDKEEVARLIGHYNFLAMPVTDFEHRLLGVVTVDDVIDIINEEASEDMQSMVGAGTDETTDSPWTYSVKKRLPWLVINVANSAISAWVVHLFEANIAKMAILAVLMPIVANQAGNTGQQALAVMIRQFATEKFDRKKSWNAVFRELKIGLANGVCIAFLVLMAVYMLTDNSALAMVMSGALFIDMLMGAVVGGAIPIILKEFGRDPAQASSIFLTTITDSLGFLSLLGLAGIFLL